MFKDGSPIFFRQGDHPSWRSGTGTEWSTWSLSSHSITERHVWRSGHLISTWLQMYGGHREEIWHYKAPFYRANVLTSIQEIYSLLDIFNSLKFKLTLLNPITQLPNSFGWYLWSVFSLKLRNCMSNIYHKERLLIFNRMLYIISLLIVSKKTSFFHSYHNSRLQLFSYKHQQTSAASKNPFCRNDSSFTLQNRRFCCLHI